MTDKPIYPSELLERLKNEPENEALQEARDALVMLSGMGKSEPRLFPETVLYPYARDEAQEAMRKWASAWIENWNLQVSEMFDGYCSIEIEGMKYFFLV